MKTIMIIGAGEAQVPLIEAARKECYHTIVCDINPRAPASLCLAIYDPKGAGPCPRYGAESIRFSAFCKRNVTSLFQYLNALFYAFNSTHRELQLAGDLAGPTIDYRYPLWSDTTLLPLRFV